MDARDGRKPRSAGWIGGAAIAVALLLCASSLAHAGPAKLVKDIERSSTSCEASDFVSGPDALYFGTGLRCRGGLALWRTDGTEDGTRLVKAFARGPRNFGFVQPIATVGDQLYFGLSEGESWGSPIVEMWRTDGTEAGTVLVWQATGEQHFDHQVKSTSQTEVAFHGKLLFFVEDGYVDSSLWVSDGTVAGTHLVRDLDGFPRYGERFLVRDDAVFFVAYGSGQTSLWRSDGTTEGTQPVHPLGLNVLEAGTPTLAPDGSVYFTVNLGTGSNELWRTGGTAETTERLVGLPFRSTWRLVGGVHFVLEARRIAVNLWRYDPATNQIMVVENLDPAPRGDNEIFVYGERNGVLLFSSYAFVGSREKLWRSDGTPDGTYVLYDGLLTYVAEGRDGFLFRPDPLEGSKPVWHTDGTAAGTREIRPASTDGIRYEGIVATSDTTLFVTTAWNSLDVLWRTDGTPAGTVAVRSIPFAPNAQGFGVLGARVLFWSASDLWRSDGTPAGTRRLLPFGTDTASAWPRSLTDVDGTLFFDVSRLFVGTNELWRTDGTKAGTRLVADFPDGTDELRLLTPSGGRLLFARGLHEFWSSDGTPEGTQLLAADLGTVADGAWVTGIATVGGLAFAAVGNVESSSGALIGADPAAGMASILAGVPPDNLAPFDGALYFTAPVSPAVLGLWRSDGTVVGTAPVATFRAATSRKRPVITRLFVDANAIFFTVGYQRRLELWRSDGTADGTTKVAALPLPTGVGGRGGVFNGTFLDGLLLFSYVPGAEPGGPNLWRSDGTEAGTVPVATVDIGLELGDMTRLGDRVLFVTPMDYPPTIYFPSDLWATDGTESGTVRLLDGDVAGSLHVVGDTAFFCATTNRSTEPLRLWRTDGTPSGTVPALDRVLSCEGEMEVSGGRLFFPVSTRHYGTELWSMPLDAP